MQTNPAAFFRALVLRMFEAVVFFTPILVLPWTVSPLEINKQTFFYVCATVGILAWLGQALFTKSLEIAWSKAWIPFLIFLGFAAVSAGLSPDAYTSIFGQGNQEYTSIVTLILGLGFAFVGAQVFDAPMTRRLLVLGLMSSAIVGFFGAFPFFGGSLGVLPTNVIGTPNALAVYLLAMSLVGSGVMMLGQYDSHRQRLVVSISTVITVCATIAVLFAIDYVVLWILAVSGCVLLFCLGLLHPSTLTRPVRFVLPMAILVSGLFFSMLPPAIANPFPSEVSLSAKSSWAIAKSVFQDGGLLFGTGPGTYAVNFSRYHSADINGTAFWDTRFDRGSSAFLTMLPTFGVPATVAWIVSLGFFIVLVCLAYRRAQHPHDLPALIGWTVLALAWFCYPQNFALMVMFWIFTALAFRAVSGRRTTFAFDHSPRTGFVVAFLFVVTSVFILTVAFATVSKYRADVAFARAAALYSGSADIDDVILALDEAASANRWSDVYYRNLGSALLKKVIVLARKTDSDPELVRALIGAAVNASIRATELGPTNVTNWELRGDVYREVTPLVADAATFAIAAYQEAVALAPNNPKYSVALARGYLVFGDVLTPIVQGDDAEQTGQAKIAQEDAFQKASDALLGAIALKSDYAEARYYLASVQERQGKLAEAVASMELVRLRAPNDVGVGLQLGLLYLRQGKNDVAKKELERIIALAPNFSNARWFLAAVLESEDDIEGALIELEAIMTIDPESETVQKKIDALRAGQLAETVLPDPLPSAEDPLLPDAPVVP
jgi:tetratricopeptide (TPR) repeat protein